MTPLVLLLLLAHTSAEVEKTCPLDGTKFKAEMDMSGTTFGKQLDLKPFGATAAPWAIAVCPTDHFPLFRQDFTPAELTDLKAYVKTAEWKALSKETSYYLTAKVMQHLKAPALDIAHVLLQATWQVDSEPRYRRYADETLTAFKAAIAGEKTHGEPWAIAQIVALELERRTDRWDDAAKRSAALRDEKLPEGVADIVAQQAELIVAKDSAPHPIGKR